MARTKVKPMVTLGSWNEVDDALRQIGECKRDIAAAESVMNEYIATATANATAKTQPISEQVAALELAIREYATLHRGDLGDLKSKTLNFGTVGFRKSTKAVLPKGKEEVRAIIERLRTLNMNDCINDNEPTVNRVALKKYGDDVVLSVGASLKTKDEFGYEVNEQKIK